MPKRYELEDIKEYLNGCGWEFIEEIPGNTKEKIKRKIRCICPNNHEADKLVDTLMKNLKCMQCILITTEKCHLLAKSKGFKFMSEGYVDFKTKYTWQCSQNHEWQTTYDSISSNGTGCPKCLKVPFSKYIELIKSKGGRVTSEEKDYVNTNSKVKYVCAYNHECESRGSHLLDGIYCMECQSTSDSERTCRKIFEYLFKVHFPKNRDFKHPDTGNYLELDGYNKELKIAFEYNGIQHYKLVEYWHTEDDFIKQQERDTIVLNLCKEADIKLIVIPYTIKHNKLYEYIAKQFPEHNFEESIDYCELKLESYRDDTLNNLKKLVKDNYKGEILSDFYVDCHTLLDCKCEKGHLFQREAIYISRGRFCTCCSGMDVIHNISEYCKIYDYTQISDHVDGNTNMKWKCNKCEHIFTKSWNLLQKIKKEHNC